MFDLTDGELVTLGIGGAVLLAACLDLTTFSPITAKVLALIVGFFMLAAALAEIVTR